MSRATQVVTLVLLVAAVARTHAQALLQEARLPEWAQQQWGVLARAESLQISSRINPFALRGDFNADGEDDVALLMKSGITGKEGIVFLLSGKSAPIVIGAGRSFGNGGDDFSWMDMWNLEPKRSSDGNHRGQSHSRRGQRIVLSREGSASALIYIEEESPSGSSRATETRRRRTSRGRLRSIAPTRSTQVG